jgi:putative ABC transport system permease protein
VKFLPLIWAGVWRRPGRAILTLLSIVTAFLLFGLLQGFASGLNQAGSLTHADVLLTFSRVSQVEPLPVSQAAQIRTVPGVAAVTPVVLFTGTYRTVLQIVPAFAVDIDQLAAADPTLITPSQATAMRGHRAGALLSPMLASRYGWKAGDTVPVRSLMWSNRDGTQTWPLDVVGVHGGAKDDIFTNISLVNYDYVDQGRTSAQGTASLFVLRVADPNHANQIASAVDRLFANSPHETKTATQRQLAQDQLKQIGDIGLVVNEIVAAAFFALLFSVGSVMMQSVRERTPELAVLKTLGFTDGGVMGLVLAEAITLCLLAAAIGLGLAYITFPAIRAATGFGIRGGPVMGVGFLIALGLALIVGLPPAIRGMRLSIVDALAGR